MGSGYHGGFGIGSTIDDNVNSMKMDYPVNQAGYFGEKGKNVRVIETETPEETSIDFFERIGKGGKTAFLANGHGSMTTLSDGTIIVHRLITSTKGSPAVSITIIQSKSIKSRKIHFIKRENENHD